MIQKKRMTIRLKKSVAIVILSFSIAMTAACADRENAAENHEIFGTQLINDSNRELIGTEAAGIAKELTLEEIERMTEEESSSEEIEASYREAWAGLAESGVLTGPAYFDIPAPSTVTEIETTGEHTPEIIMSNGACAVFTQGDGKGWSCEAGDRISYSFEKYPSEVVADQMLIIGYIQNGLFYKGEGFTDLSGTFSLDILERGEYLIYALSATSDYLALKGGTIFIE